MEICLKYKGVFSKKGLPSSTSFTIPVKGSVRRLNTKRTSKIVMVTGKRTIKPVKK